MAQKAKKELAKANTAALNDLHTVTIALHLVFLSWHFLASRRSMLAYVLLSTPSVLCEYILETTGRPKYDAATKQLKNPGEDMAAAGLTEYMFDLVWVTWATLVLVILVGNRAWFLMAIVPAYGIYLGSGLLGMGRQKMAQMQGAQSNEQATAPQGNRRARRAA